MEKCQYCQGEYDRSKMYVSRFLINGINDWICEDCIRMNVLNRKKDHGIRFMSWDYPNRSSGIYSEFPSNPQKGDSAELNKFDMSYWYNGKEWEKNNIILGECVCGQKIITKILTIDQGGGKIIFPNKNEQCSHFTDYIKREFIFNITRQKNLPMNIAHNTKKYYEAKIIQRNYPLTRGVKQAVL
jgi:hypothetical protein